MKRGALVPLQFALGLGAVAACTTTQSNVAPRGEVPVSEPASSSAAAGEEPAADLQVSTPQGCYDSCNGTAPGPLQDALRQRAADAKGCFEHELRTDPTLNGRVVVTLDISEFGKVCATQVTSEQLDKPTLLNCIRQLFLDHPLPEPIGGCVVVAVPITLVPDAPDAGTRDAATPDAASP